MRNEPASVRLGIVLQQQQTMTATDVPYPVGISTTTIEMNNHHSPCTRGNRLLDEGIYVTGFYYPVVPKGQARIRVQISAGHNREQLDRCINAFIKIGKELGVLKQLVQGHTLCMSEELFVQYKDAMCRIRQIYESIVVRGKW